MKVQNNWGLARSKSAWWTPSSWQNPSSVWILALVVPEHSHSLSLQNTCWLPTHFLLSVWYGVQYSQKNNAWARSDVRSFNLWSKINTVKLYKKWMFTVGFLCFTHKYICTARSWKSHCKRGCLQHVSCKK